MAEEHPLPSFVAKNQTASVQFVGNDVLIRTPWNDESVSLQFPVSGSDAVVEALNAVFLPPRFTALWHTDSKDLEFIWSPTLPLNIFDEYKTRAFKFLFRGATYQCEFAPPSARLLAISEAADFSGLPTSTEYRNLKGFRGYVRWIKSGKKMLDLGALCFWIRAIDWDDDIVLELARHLNFYMLYFDKKTTVIKIHDPGAEGGDTEARFLYGPFPPAIPAAELNSDLLDLSEAVRMTSSVFLQFLWCFQIVEYVASSYFDAETIREIRSLLFRPEIFGDADRLIAEAIDRIIKAPGDDIGRFEMLVRNVVDPEPCRKIIEANRRVFYEPLDFDGGLHLDPIFRDGMDQRQFCDGWKKYQGFTTAMRKIRNGIAHAKEQRFSTLISPTKTNERLMWPLVWVMKIVAEQVIHNCCVQSPPL